MKSSDKPQEADNSASDIVRIAYREIAENTQLCLTILKQSRVISNCEEPEDSSKAADKEGFVCKNRIMALPIIASINSSITDAYSSVKSSHAAVESILNHTEEGLAEGVKIVSPVTTKIGESLEEPLKTIDTVICGGLDYLEEKVPAVKLPPGEIYENVEGYIRDVSDSVKKHSNELYTDVKVKLNELSKVVEAQTEKTEKPSKKQKNSDD